MRFLQSGLICVALGVVCAGGCSYDLGDYVATTASSSESSASVGPGSSSSSSAMGGAGSTTTAVSSTSSGQGGAFPDLPVCAPSGSPSDTDTFEPAAAPFWVATGYGSFASDQGGQKVTYPASPDLYPFAGLFINNPTHLVLVDECWIGIDIVDTSDLNGGFAFAVLRNGTGTELASIRVRNTGALTANVGASSSFVGMTHGFVRFAEHAGALYFQTRAAGESDWTTIGSTSSSFLSLPVGFGFGTRATNEPTPDSATFDDFNIPPT